MTEPEHINYPLVRPAAFQGGASKAETSQAAVYNIHLTHLVIPTERRIGNARRVTPALTGFIKPIGCASAASLRHATFFGGACLVNVAKSGHRDAEKRKSGS
jgi:hypothetical protein